jgi:osmotically-inducible protein OsmY
MRQHPAFASSIVVVLALLGGGCAITDGQSSVGQYVDDAAITARVKSRMAEDPQVSAMRIKVETMNGLVQLSGFAASDAEKLRAAQIARNTKHVDEVRNDIVVRSAGR